ncbi:hypothetical protein [Alteromonas mediterranea]|jgi:hypothetical protein|uniref:hypothetical protein n=1 Tax=Alteromonas mediterranea TaxID=314275 RepID=UPI0032B2F2F4|tara:strand:+ start:2052 stop:2324 length:273 start_codon:yes stop_codon:yes gene_type:complete
MRHLQNHYRWIIVALTVINQAAIIGFALSSFAIFSVPWLEQYNVSVGQLMIPSVMFLVINSLLSPVIGPRLDKIPLRLPIVAGFILYAVG